MGIRIISMMAQFLVLILLSLFSLSGCLPGNAEGYGKKPDSSNQMPSGGGDGGVNALQANYYLLDPTYTCIKPGENVPIPSYRQSILVSGEKVYLRGDRCGEIKAEILLKEISLSSTRQYLGFQDDSYLYIGEPITDALLASLRPVEALCLAVDPKTEEVYDIAVRNPIKAGDPLTAHIQFASHDLILNIERHDTVSQRIYSAPDVDLSIGSDAVDFIHEGTWKALISSQSFDEKMRCRMKP